MREAKRAIMMCVLLAVPAVWAEDGGTRAAKPDAKESAPVTAAGGQSAGASFPSDVFADVSVGAVAVVVGSVAAAVAIANGGSSSTTQH